MVFEKLPSTNKQARALPMGPCLPKPAPVRLGLICREGVNGEGPQGRRHAAAAHGFRIGDF